MKFFHLSDLHLGKNLHEFSLLEDQEYILKSILGLADEQSPDAVLIAGDVFDRSVAPTEALRLFDDFLGGLVRRNIEVYIISGNHDSADRLAFGARLMDVSGVHISKTYDKHIQRFAFKDAYGTVNVFLMPFLKPSTVRRFYPEEAIETWTDAVRVAIGHTQIDEMQRNVLLAHQFVTGAQTCESEEINIGGADNVDAEVFNAFDYVALGHLHGAQSVAQKTIRYCGTPIKYSFSEAKHKKTVSVVTLREKGDIIVEEIPLVPLRDLREIRGDYLLVTSRAFYQDQNTDDYIRITLTDEEDQPDAMKKLRVIYPNLMRLDYDNQRTRSNNALMGVSQEQAYRPMELFEMFYEMQNGQGISQTQRDCLDELIQGIWEGGR